MAVGIERHRHVPDPAAIERGRRAAVQDAVAIAPARRREAGMEVARHDLGLGDRRSGWASDGSSAPPAPCRRASPSARSRCATWPSACTPVSVRPAPWTAARSPQKANTASSSAPWIDGPLSWRCQPTNGAAVVFDGELVARHGRVRSGSGTTAGGGSTVPAGQREAAQKGVGRLRRLAGRCSFRSFKPADAAGHDGKAVARRRSPCPARRRPAASAASSTLMRSPVERRTRCPARDGRRAPCARARRPAGASRARLPPCRACGRR